ncbi:hypothetical protein HDR63_00620 [bacterium]|nr:hypothetical protein [bacterium]
MPNPNVGLNPAVAAECPAKVCVSGELGIIDDLDGTVDLDSKAANCATTKMTCYGESAEGFTGESTGLESCVTCLDGYVKEERTVPFQDQRGNECTVTYYTCVKETKCPQGQYKQGTTCVACPSSGTTDAAGMTAVTQCYLAAGTAFSDASGAGVYAAKCPWVN